MISRYVILDHNLKNIGILTPDKKSGLVTDSITHQLSDPDKTSNSGENPTSGGEAFISQDPNAKSKNYAHTGNFTVIENAVNDSKIVVGNSVAYYDDQLSKWYVLYIWDTKKSLLASGLHAINAQVEDLAAFDLHNRIPEAKTLESATLKQACDWIFEGVDWTIDIQSQSALTCPLTIDGKNKAISYLQTILQNYNVEADCYFKLDAGNSVIVDKVITIGDKINSQMNYEEAMVGKNVTALSHETIGSPVSKLYVFGASGKSIASANGGKPYLIDDDANRMYNPDWQNGTYLEASITATQIDNPQGLLQWGKEQLQLLNHNRDSYELTCTHNYNPPLGSTIRIKDFMTSPSITFEARVLSKTISICDPSQDTFQAGEFVTVQAVTPSWIKGISDKLAYALQQARDDASSIKPVILTPDGTDFNSATSSKRAILQAWEAGTNFSAFVDNKGFLWKKIDSSGLFTGQTMKGYSQSNVSQVGTWRGYINTKYISDTPEVDLNQTSSAVAKLGQFMPKINGHSRAAQYIVKLHDGSYMSSHDWGSYGGGSNDNDTLYVHWDSNFNYISSMVIQDGGHGSSFGVDYLANPTGPFFIWGVTKDFSSTSARYRVTCVSYQPGKTLASTDSTLSNYLTFSSNDYIRVNYDMDHQLIGITRQNGDYDVIKVSDVKSGTLAVLYSINMFDYGFNANDQTFQSSCLSFPYVFWHSGDIDMHDPRTIYAVNLIHQGQEFQSYYNFDSAFDDTYNEREPEALSMMPDGRLLVSFNMHDTSSGSDVMIGEYVYAVPLITRTAMPAISNGQIGE